MGQAKKQQNETIDETKFVSDALVETIWDQYEAALTQSRKRREERDKAYMNAVKSTNQFNRQYRNMIKGFYQETRNTNVEIFKGLSSNITEKLDKEQEPQEDSKEVQNQWSDTIKKLEEITLTPIKQSFDMMDRYEKRVEENTESYIKNVQQSRNAWSSVTKEYVKLLRNQNKILSRRLEGSFQNLVKN